MSRETSPIRLLWSLSGQLHQSLEFQACQVILLPALVVGMGTVVAPLRFMQLAMGAGVFASRTPTPVRNCLKSLATHFVFGVGMFLRAGLLALM